ncbi:DUF493 family protein, partial [Salmonella enterica subsp. enterica serovar Virginia]|nr:DUF493 family protein [Salmonella enterica subsp. enterica serovar Virginia]
MRFGNRHRPVLRLGKLDELLEFPTPFTYKVMGQALPELVDQVVEVVQRHAPGDYSPTV